MSYDDYYARMDNTKPVDSRDPFIGEGPHRLAVLSIEEYQHKEKGPAAKVLFEVLKSGAHALGSRVTKLYFLTRPSKFPNQINDGDRFADFVRKLKSAPVGHPIGQDCRALLRDRAAEHLARGMVIDAMGTNTGGKVSPVTGLKSKDWVEVYWTSVPQTREEISANRARIESTPGLLPAPVQTQPVVQPVQQPLLAQLKTNGDW